MALQAWELLPVPRLGMFQVLQRENRGNPAPSGVLFQVFFPEQVIPAAEEVVVAYP